MEILKETPVNPKFVDLEVTMSKEELKFYIAYAKKNMPRKEIEDLLVNWAFIDVLKKALESEEKHGTLTKALKKSAKKSAKKTQEYPNLLEGRPFNINFSDPKVAPKKIGKNGTKKKAI